MTLKQLHAKYRELTQQLYAIRQQRADIECLIEKQVGVPLDVVTDDFIAVCEPVEGSELHQSRGDKPFDMYSAVIDGVQIRCFKELPND